MLEENIVQLLKVVQLILSKDQKEDYKQGKKFNVFSIQRTASDEVKICCFIRELLDPKGSHGQGDFFLRKFMKNVIRTDEVFTNEEYYNACIIQEYIIHNDRRIDIVIHISKRWFPIEVKIYASDQIDQCFDYYHYMEQIDSDVKLYYLTLDGHEPSSESKRDLKQEDYTCVSFSVEILAWLNECINSSELEKVYPVKEVLIQFRNTIEMLSGKMRGELLMAMKDIIGSSYENMKAAIQISNALPGIRADLMQKIFEEIKNHMKDLGFARSKDFYRKESASYYSGVGHMTWPSINYILQMPDKTLEGKIALRFEIGEYLYLGIVPWFGQNNNDGKKSDRVAIYVKENLKPEDIHVHEEGKDECWYWWKYCNEDCHANFRHGNDEYLKLFDDKGYEKYMQGIYRLVDSIVNSIPMLREET